MNIYKSVIVLMAIFSVSLCAADLKEEGVTVIKIKMPKVESATDDIAKATKATDDIAVATKATTDISKVRLIIDDPQKIVSTNIEQTIKSEDNRTKKMDNNSSKK